jgi:hypothetical protein
LHPCRGCPTINNIINDAGVRVQGIQESGERHVFVLIKTGDAALSMVHSFSQAFAREQTDMTLDEITQAMNDITTREQFTAFFMDTTQISASRTKATTSFSLRCGGLLGLGRGG